MLLLYTSTIYNTNLMLIHTNNIFFIKPNILVIFNSLSFTFIKRQYSLKLLDWDIYLVYLFVKIIYFNRKDYIAYTKKDKPLYSQRLN